MTAALHSVDVLFERLNKIVTAYPKPILAIANRIPGEAFFPGGPGLCMREGTLELPRFPCGKVMVIGQDFDSETAYRASLQRGRRDPNSPTWNNLLRFLKRVGIG